MRFFDECHSFGGVLGGKTWSEEQFGPVKSLSGGQERLGQILVDLEASLDVILGVFFAFLLSKIVVAISVEKKSRNKI